MVRSEIDRTLSCFLDLDKSSEFIVVMNLLANQFVSMHSYKMYVTEQ